jgi:hypothetical protein
MKALMYCFRLSVFISLLVASSGQAQGPGFNWSESAGGTAKDYGNAIAVDYLGNIYVTGEFTGTANFDSIAVVSAGNVDYYLAKYDSNRVIQWVKIGGASLTDRGYGVAIDKNNDVIAAGHFFGTAQFDTASLTSGGNLDLFIAKYNSDGEMQWISQGTGVSQVSPRALAVDTAGNSLVAAYFGSSTSNTVTFGTITLTSNGNRDACIVKYDPDGNPLWAKNAGGPNSGEEAIDIAVDLAGNVYVTGMFVDSAYFDNLTLYSNGATDIFLAKYDKDGQIIWVKNAGGLKNDVGSTIALDNLGNLYVGGRFDSAAVFETTNVVSAGLNDAFIAKYDTSGNLIWIRYGGGTDQDYCNDIYTDRFGDILVTGQFRVTATFGTTDLISAGADDIFILKVLANGDLEWAYRAGGTDIDKGLACTVDYGGNFYGTGYFRLTADFGSTNLISAGLDEIFITRIGNFPIPVELVSFNAFVGSGVVNLNWKTATELNNRGFEIERSEDKINFTSIGFIEGVGTTTDPVEYSFIDNAPLNGTNYYRLKQIDYNGQIEYSNIIEVDFGIPVSFIVSDNYPNPFNPVTNIRIDLPVESNVTIKFYNSVGEVVKTINSNGLTSGSTVFQIDGSNLASGIYYYSVQLNGLDGSSFIKTSKMVLLK